LVLAPDLQAISCEDTMAFGFAHWSLSLARVCPGWLGSFTTQHGMSIRAKSPKCGLKGIA